MNRPPILKTLWECAAAGSGFLLDRDDVVSINGFASDAAREIESLRVRLVTSDTTMHNLGKMNTEQGRRISAWIQRAKGAESVLLMLLENLPADDEKNTALRAAIEKHLALYPETP